MRERSSVSANVTVLLAGLTEMLFRPQPMSDILASLLLDPAAPLPVSISRSTAPSGRTGSVAMYTCVSVSTESMYLSLGVRASHSGSLHVGMADGAQLLKRVLRELQQRPAVAVPRLQRGQRRVEDEQCQRLPVVLKVSIGSSQARC